MSRVGRAPVLVPDGVECVLKGSTVKVSGPRGFLELTFPNAVQLESDGKQVLVRNLGQSKFDLSIWGTVRSNLKQMIIGVSSGFVRDIEFCRHEAVLRTDLICYGLDGSQVKPKESFLYLKLGKSHKFFVAVPSYINVDSVQQSSKSRGQSSIVRLSCTDDAKLGEFCSSLVKQSPVFPYAIKKGMRGIKYLDRAVVLNRVDTKKSSRGKK